MASGPDPGPTALEEEAQAPRRESLVERALSNLAVAWREVSAGAARTLGLSRPRLSDDLASLRRLMQDCLEARGGEVSARLRAAELGRAYLALPPAGRQRFLALLASDFDVDEAKLGEAIERYRAASGEERMAAEEALRRALQPQRVKLLTQFTTLPDGVKFLVDLRAELQGFLAKDRKDKALAALDRDLRGLLENWFDLGFLDLRLITWDSPASLLEKIIAYEAVHAIGSWSDLRKRLSSDRRLYGLFHPRMPEEPLAFVEVALTRELADSIQAVLDEDAPAVDAREAQTAIFYSISNTQAGLAGIAFGEWLIKRVVHRLSEELPQLETFATLSPVPSFRRWLAAKPAEFLTRHFSETEQGGIRALGGSDDLKEALAAVLQQPDWHADPVVAAALEKPLRRLCLLYLLLKREDGQPLDPVARFHLRNGARLERINWLADVSPNGLKLSAGVMVNYLYDLEAMDANHEAFVTEGRIALSSDLRTASRGLKEEAIQRRRA